MKVRNCPRGSTWNFSLSASFSHPWKTNQFCALHYSLLTFIIFRQFFYLDDFFFLFHFLIKGLYTGYDCVTQDDSHFGRFSSLAHYLGNNQQAPRKAWILAKAIVWIGCFQEVRELFQKFSSPF